MSIPIFSYLRVSGVGQISGDGPDRQRESISKFATQHDFEVKSEFYDAAVKGTTDGVDRPALTDLFAAIRANGVRTVLVERSDRIARDLMIGEIILSEFRKLGVKVYECEGGNELTVENQEPTRVLIRQILGAVSQFEKAVIVQKLRAARIRARKLNGRCEGPKPYGQKPGESEVLQTMVRLRGLNFHFQKIADTLNRQGIMTRSGGSWRKSGVHGILANYKPNESHAQIL